MSLAKPVVQEPGLALKLWGRYLNALETSPVLTKCVTAALISGTGNVFAQKCLEPSMPSPISNKRKQLVVFGVDVKRLAKFMVFAFVFGPVLHYWYVWLGRLFKDRPTSTRITLLKLLLDQLVFTPIVNAGFFTYMSLVSGAQLSDVPSAISANLWPTLVANWTVWPAAQWFNFSYVPPALQVAFGNIVSLFWNSYLTLVTQRKDHSRSRRR